MTDLILGNAWPRSVHRLPGRPFGVGPPTRSTIVGALALQARAIPETPYLTQIGPEPSTLTYAAAHAAVQRRAGLLMAAGLGRGDRVGVLGYNSAELALAVLAVLEAGGVAVLLSPHDPADRVARQVAFTEAAWLLHDGACASAAHACPSPRRMWSFQDLASACQPDSLGVGARPAPTDAALIFFTSGTTGAPKAVVQSHLAVAQNAWSLVEHHRLRPGTRLLCVLPLHHVNGLEFTILAVLLGGGHTVLSQGFDAFRFWPTVREHNIHIASLVPNLLRLLASRPELRGPESVPLDYVVSAAAPLSVAIAREAWERLDLRIVQGYGLSEVTNFSCLMPRDLSTADYSGWMLQGRRTSVGPALPNQVVEVHDGEALAAPGTQGEIVIRGPCVMSGYLHNPSATDEAFRGGWFHTGDLGYWLPDSAGRPFVHVSGRTREIAKRSGTLVSLLELDEILASIPGVADAGCVGFANTWVDEEIGALVVPQAGSTLTAQGVIHHCRRSLPFAATPKQIKFVKQIPRTPSGKIRRAEIAEHFAEYRERLFVEPRTKANPAGPAAQGDV
jgi:acyl-CoA synthetase (AMP-forming)/AMP-acid ligase II